MQMQIGVPGAPCDLVIVDFAKPVIGRDSAAVAQNQPAHRIGDGRILFNASHSLSR